MRSRNIVRKSKSERGFTPLLSESATVWCDTLVQHPARLVMMTHLTVQQVDSRHVPLVSVCCQVMMMIKMKINPNLITNISMTTRSLFHLQTAHVLVLFFMKPAQM
jgi:hypothetical protein